MHAGRWCANFWSLGMKKRRPKRNLQCGWSASSTGIKWRLTHRQLPKENQRSKGSERWAGAIKVNMCVTRFEKTQPALARAKGTLFISSDFLSKWLLWTITLNKQISGYLEGAEHTRGSLAWATSPCCPSFHLSFWSDLLHCQSSISHGWRATAVNAAHGTK